MDDRRKIRFRELKREFSVNRHSLSVIADAFRLLSGACTDQKPKRPSVQTSDSISSLTKPQEVQ